MITVPITMHVIITRHKSVTLLTY